MNNAERERLYETAKKQQRILNVMQERLKKTGAESNRKITNKVKARLNETWKKMTTAFQGAGLPPPRAATKEGELLIDILPILAEQGFGRAVQQARFVSPETSTIDKTLPGSHAWVINHSPATSEAAAARAMRRGPDGSTQLIRAVRAGDEAEVSRLIQLGAPLNSANIHGSTALLTAAIYRPTQYKLFELLLDAGANPNLTDAAGATPLIVVASKNEPTTNVCRLLLDAGADVNQADHYGSTPLIVACMWGDVDRCKLLVERGANVNAVNDIGRTPLILAMTLDDKVCRLLVDAGADVNAVDQYGRTPLMESSIIDSVNICRFLLAAGADINQADHYGMTALMYAADGNCISVCKFLLERGADITKADDRGQTAIDYANAAAGWAAPAGWANDRRIVELFETWTREHCSGSKCAVMGGTRKRRQRKVKKTRRRTLASSRVKRQ
jgi:ankyrin repeat protein